MTNETSFKTGSILLTAATLLCMVVGIVLLWPAVSRSVDGDSAGTQNSNAVMAESHRSRLDEFYPAHSQAAPAVDVPLPVVPRHITRVAKADDRAYTATDTASPLEPDFSGAPVRVERRVSVGDPASAQSASDRVPHVYVPVTVHPVTVNVDTSSFAHELARVNQRIDGLAQTAMGAASASRRSPPNRLQQIDERLSELNQRMNALATDRRRGRLATAAGEMASGPNAIQYFCPEPRQETAVAQPTEQAEPATNAVIDSAPARVMSPIGTGNDDVTPAAAVPDQTRPAKAQLQTARRADTSPVDFSFNPVPQPAPTLPPQPVTPTPAPRPTFDLGQPTKVAEPPAEEFWSDFEDVPAPAPADIPPHRTPAAVEIPEAPTLDQNMDWGPLDIPEAAPETPAIRVFDDLPEIEPAARSGEFNEATDAIFNNMELPESGQQPPVDDAAKPILLIPDTSQAIPLRPTPDLSEVDVDTAVAALEQLTQKSPPVRQPPQSVDHAHVPSAPPPREEREDYSGATDRLLTGTLSLKPAPPEASAEEFESEATTWLDENVAADDEQFLDLDELAPPDKAPEPMLALESATDETYFSDVFRTKGQYSQDIEYADELRFSQAARWGELEERVPQRPNAHVKASYVSASDAVPRENSAAPATDPVEPHSCPDCNATATHQHVHHGSRRQPAAVQAAAHRKPPAVLANAESEGVFGASLRQSLSGIRARVRQPNINMTGWMNSVSDSRPAQAVHQSNSLHRISSVFRQATRDSTLK